MVRRHVLGFTALALLGCTSYVAAGCGGSTNTSNEGQSQNDAGEDSGGSGSSSGSAGASSSGGAEDSGAKTDGGHDAGMEAGHTPSSMYPAFPVDTPTVVNNGGKVLSAPNIVTVTWSSDTQAATWNAFDDSIGPTTYWKAINSEYGVGAATGGSANHVSITTTAPTTMSDADLDTLVSTNVGNGTWPANTPNTIYAVYMPPGAALTFGGQNACQAGVGGYHEESQAGDYVYAIMPQCQGFQAADIELSASHELNEAATDPHPNTTTAYAGFDQDHLAWEFFQSFQDELGDACELYPWSAYTDSETNFSYAVQRQWSNAAAQAGHDPCVPAAAGPFYDVTAFPSEQTTINVNISSLGLGVGTVTSKGYKGTLNQPLTFHLGAYSDAPTTGMWNITTNFDLQLQDQNGNAVTNGTATVTLDKTSVINGDTITVTVTPTNWGSLGVVYMWFRNIMPNAGMGAAHGDYAILVSQN
ncbi:MAG TPA: hypothetical protein VMI75_31795 [Polyangiaceae bacterium]|nr:hypothetical protein [Polyangiaceae bacterium]